MPRGVPNGKSPTKERAEREALLAQARRDLAAMPDKDVLVDDLHALLAQERLISDNERINITVEYACLGQDPKPEKYIGRPRYIKPSRHGRTRLAKRSARRDDIPPPVEKMFVYDDEVARYLHGAKYPTLRRPGTEYVPKKDDEPMEEDDHKEHSRDSGCPVSPADKQAGDKKDNEPGSSRASVEKDNRKRPSPSPLTEEANTSSGTSHFIVKGNTPLTIIHKLLERKRQVPADLRLELMDASGKEILTDDEMRWTVADLANRRGWTRNRPLRILYTITRFTESEDLPVLDVQARCDIQQQQGSPAVMAPPPSLQAGPSQAQLAQLQQQQQFHYHQQQRIQQQQQQHQYQPQMALLIQPDGTEIAIPYEQLLASNYLQQHDREALLKMAQPHRLSPPHIHTHQWASSHHHPFGGMMTPPTSGPSGPSGNMQPLQPSQLQQQMTSSIFPPGHVLIEHAHGSQLVSANASVESVISNAASVKKRQRMAPRRTKERDELMARKGIERGTTFTGGKARGTQLSGMPPGIVSIRMPAGCNPKMLEGPEARDLPIEAITVDGRSHPTTIRELERGALSKVAAAAMAAHAAAAARAASQPPPLQLTPPECETIPIVRTTKSVERRGSCSSSEADASAAATAAPQLSAVVEPPKKEEEEVPPPLSPPPRLDVSELPDSPRSLEIDERMDEEPPKVVPVMQRIPA